MLEACYLLTNSAAHEHVHVAVDGTVANVRHVDSDTYNVTVADTRENVEHEIVDNQHRHCYCKLHEEARL